MRKTYLITLLLLAFAITSCKKEKTVLASQPVTTSPTHPNPVDTTKIQYKVSFTIQLAHPKTFLGNSPPINTDYKQTSDSIKVYVNGNLYNPFYKTDNTSWNSGLYQIDNQLINPELTMKTGDSITVIFNRLEYTGNSAFLNNPMNFIKITQLCLSNSSKNVYGTDQPILDTHTASDLAIDKFLGQDNSGGSGYTGMDWYLGKGKSFTFYIKN